MTAVITGDDLIWATVMLLLWPFVFGYALALINKVLRCKVGPRRNPDKSMRPE